MGQEGGAGAFTPFKSRESLGCSGVSLAPSCGSAVGAGAGAKVGVGTATPGHVGS